jgi:hypothetical protein
MEPSIHDPRETRRSTQAIRPAEVADLYPQRTIHRAMA